ncbi:MAG TPA: hypothetical protein VMY18_12605 [Acidobacteriota bacterium]|nr:hypothetical protein [Acidobacteriota bacterium]
MMDKHLTVLGALFLGLGAMGLIGLIIVLMIFGLASTLIGATAVEQGEAPAFVAAIPGIFGLLIATLISVGTIPNLFAGYGLIKRRPWAKVVALVAGILSFPAFPMGTGVGLYAIWVFLQDDTETCLAG